MQEGALKCIGTVKNGQFHPIDSHRRSMLLGEYEGMLVDEYITPHEEEKTESQLGYFFGVIIRKVCMQSEVFGGWSEKEVVDYFVSTFLTEKQVKNIGGGDGQNRLVFEKVHRLSGLSKRKAAEFIDKVINHLALKWDIQCPDPSQYYIEKSQRT